MTAILLGTPQDCCQNFQIQHHLTPDAAGVKAQRTWGFSHQQWGYFIGFTLKNGDLTMWLAATGNLFRDIREIKLRLVKFNPILRELPNHSHYSVAMRDGRWPICPGPCTVSTQLPAVEKTIIRFLFGSPRGTTCQKEREREIYIYIYMYIYV